MKQKHLYSLLDQSFTTVRAVFDHKRTTNVKAQRQPNPPPFLEYEYENERGYVYKVPRAWNVEPQDHLIVLTDNDGLKIVTVIHVDAEPDIDIDASYDYKWAVQKIDLTEFRSLTEREKEFSDTMLQIERVKQRESLVNSFRDSLPEGSEARKLFEQTTSTLAPPTIDVEPAPRTAE
jgi:hypothetical protein